MLRVCMFMKSGNKVEFECESLKKTNNGFSVLTELEWKNGESKNRLLEVDLNNVEAITVHELGDGTSETT